MWQCRGRPGTAPQFSKGKTSNKLDSLVRTAELHLFSPLECPVTPTIFTRGTSFERCPSKPRQASQDGFPLITSDQCVHLLSPIFGMVGRLTHFLERLKITNQSLIFIDTVHNVDVWKLGESTHLQNTWCRTDLNLPCIEGRVLLLNCLKLRWFGDFCGQPQIKIKG